MLLPSCGLSVSCNTIAVCFIWQAEELNCLFCCWKTATWDTVWRGNKLHVSKKVIRTCQDENVSHAFLVELLHHLGQVSKPNWVKGEDSALVSIIQVVPLHILLEQMNMWKVTACWKTTSVKKQQAMEKKHCFFIYQRKLGFPHAFCDSSCLIGGAVAPAAQVKSQCPVGRHHGISCWGQRPERPDARRQEKWHIKYVSLLGMFYVSVCVWVSQESWSTSWSVY